MRYINAYGPTEASVCATTFDASETRVAGEVVPIGRPLRSTAVRVLDDCDRLVPVGVVGELGVMGPTLAAGYRGRSALTAEKFITWRDPKAGPQRLYRTGDLVSWGADGQLRFHGRRDHQIKLRGHRIELGEIEATARRVAGIDDALAVIVGLPSRLVLYVLSAEAGGETVAAELRRHLPDYMVPAKVMRLARWPLSPNGKVDRAQLPSPTEADEADVGRAPASEGELALAAAWGAVLAAAPTSVNTDFFAAGGDSIRALQVVAHLRRVGWTGRLAELFRAPRLGEFAGTLRRMGANDAMTGEVERDTGRLSPIQQWFFTAHPTAPWAQFNQGVRLELAAAVDIDRLGRAWAWTQQRHAALRTRFIRDEHGDWLRQTNGPRGVFPTQTIMEADIAGGGVDALIKEMQAAFDLANGPLVQTLLVTAGASRHLVVLAHHLVIDWVSWRLVLGDWERAYREDSDPGEDGAGAPADYGVWVANLVRWSRASERASLAARWRDRQAEVAAATRAWDGVWPRASWGNYGDVVVGSAGIALGALGRASGGTALRNRILAALVRVMGRTLEGAKVTVELESHGRALTPGGAAIEGTVGWFTALYPVILDMGRSGDASLAVATTEVAARIDADPDLNDAALALGAYRPDLPSKADCVLGFNFLGTMDAEGTAPADDALWRLTDDALPGAIHPAFPRDHAIDCTAYVWGGTLEVRVAGVPALTDASLVQTWADAVAEELKETKHE